MPRPLAVAVTLATLASPSSRPRPLRSRPNPRSRATAPGRRSTSSAPGSPPRAPRTSRAMGRSSSRSRPMPRAPFDAELGLNLQTRACSSGRTRPPMSATNRDRLCAGHGQRRRRRPLPPHRGASRAASGYVPRGFTTGTHPVGAHRARGRQASREDRHPQGRMPQPARSQAAALAALARFGRHRIQFDTFRRYRRSRAVKVAYTIRVLVQGDQ